MLLPGEAVIQGTWGGGPVPAELINFTLMREFHWTFDDLKATPMYVLRYCWDYLQATWQHEQDEADTQQRRSGQGG